MPLALPRKYHHSKAGAVVEWADIPRDDILSHKPVRCHYFKDRLLSKHFSFFLATILSTLYGAAPRHVIEHALGAAGVEPPRLSLDNPLHLTILAYYRHVLVSVCSTCFERGCIWRTALHSLKIYSPASEQSTETKS